MAGITFRRLGPGSPGGQGQNQTCRAAGQGLGGVSTWTRSSRRARPAPVGTLSGWTFFRAQMEEPLELSQLRAHCCSGVISQASALTCVHTCTLGFTRWLLPT